MSQQPGGQHPGVVEHQAVPRPQQLGEIEEVHMGGLAALPVQDQQPGGVPPLQRGLSNQLLRQIKIKISGFYGLRTSIPV